MWLRRPLRRNRPFLIKQPLLRALQVVQIFGGRGLTRTGMGRFVERFKNTYKFAAILGGSEEIMADLGIKLSMKSFPKNAKL